LDPYPENPSQKRAGEVVEGTGPELKTPACKNKTATTKNVSSL
jgi:hypothetical protein